MPDEPHQPEPRRNPLCPKCFGSGKAFTFGLVEGHTRELWVSCPQCSGEHRLISGPE